MQVSIRKPPRKPPKPKRLLDRHTSRLQPLREDGKDQDQECSTALGKDSKHLDEEEEVVDVHNFDSTKSQ